MRRFLKKILTCIVTEIIEERYHLDDTFRKTVRQISLKKKKSSETESFVRYEIEFDPRMTLFIGWYDAIGNRALEEQVNFHDLSTLLKYLKDGWRQRSSEVRATHLSKLSIGQFWEDCGVSCNNFIRFTENGSYPLDTFEKCGDWVDDILIHFPELKIV